VITFRPIRLISPQPQRISNKPHRTNRQETTNYAVGRFLRTGDIEWLKPFVGKRVGGIELLTDPDRLQILADADLVKLDALYRQNRGGRE
jgi:hypothetical protein